MLKIVVFDGGWGGEIVANYLANELKIVEIIRVIDWRHAPYEDKTLTQVCHYAEDSLREYFGKVDLIVLGGYMSSYAIGYLQRRYCRQKFVGMSINYYRILKSRLYPSDITVMMNNSLIDTPICDTMREKLPFSTLVVPDCSGWETLINDGVISEGRIRSDLEDYFELAPKKTYRKQDRDTSILSRIIQEKYGLKTDARVPPTSPDTPLIHSDVVLLLNTNFWEIRGDLERIFGYNVRVLDFRQKLLHDVCAALNLLGVDGERSK